MTDQADQTIVIRYLVEADEAIKNGQQIKANTIAIREQLKELAKTSNLTYKEMADGMEKAFRTKKWTEFKNWTQQNPLLDAASIKAQAAEVRKEIDAYVASLRTALSQLNTETRTSSKIWEDSKKAEALTAKDAGKKIIQSEKEALEVKKQATREWIANNQQQANAMKYLASTAKEASDSASSGATSGKSFIGSFKGIAGAVAGITSLVAVLSKVKDYLIGAAKSAKDFAQATFSLAVGVRALQRAGVDITMRDINTQLINLKKNFGIFSTKELVEGSAAFLNLNRDMGFTKEQLFELQNAIATLAVINGRSMDEVQKTVALALSSGYTEGLQRLGVSINRVTIAQEAARLGWKGGYTALNEQQRAQATYNLTLKKTNIYQDDLLEYQKTAPGKIDAMNARLEDQTMILGTKLLPLWVEFVSLLADIATFFTQNSMLSDDAYIQAYSQAAWEKAGYKGDFMKAYWWGVGTVRRETGKIYREAERSYKETIDRLKKELGKEEFQKLTPEQIIAEGLGTLGGLGDTEVARLEKAMENISSIIDEKYDEIMSIREEYEDGMKDASEEYYEDLEDMEVEHGRKIEELFEDHLRKLDELAKDHQRRTDDLKLEHSRNLDDIALEYERDRADLELETANESADIWADYYDNLASAEANYRNRQIDAEVKYQETLLRLRESFLLDLEDALQARDARQVLRLIRRYNLEEEQANRNFQQEMDRMKREQEERLAELARQRDERLRQLAEEIAAKWAMLELEHQRKLEDEDRRFSREQLDERARYEQARIDEQAAWEQSKIDERERYAQEKIDREAKYAEELADLEEHMNDRYEEIGTALASEVELTEENMELVRIALNDTLGPGGEADAIYNHFIAKANAAMQAAAGAIAYIAALDTVRLRSLQHGSPWWNWGEPGVPLPLPDKDKVPGMAEGGVAVADRATSVTFGEAGTELAAFIPLKDIASIPSALAALGSGLGAAPSSSGNMKIELWLDRYLEGRIVDDAVNTVADVVMRRFMP